MKELVGQGLCSRNSPEKQPKLDSQLRHNILKRDWTTQSEHHITMATKPRTESKSLPSVSQPSHQRESSTVSVCVCLFIYTQAWLHSSVLPRAMAKPRSYEFRQTTSCLPLGAAMINTLHPKPLVSVQLFPWQPQA